MRLESYNYDLTITLENNKLSYEGIIFKKKYINHSFSIGTPCLVKFRTKKVEGIISKISAKFITIDIPTLNTTKKSSLEDFIQANFTLESYIRLEYNNEGIYQCKEIPTPIKELFNQHQEEIRNEERKNQPLPWASFGYNFTSHLKDFKFAFPNYEAMFNWFSLDEIQLFMNHNVKIVYVQELRDFVDTVYSSEQIAYTKTDKYKHYRFC